MRQDSHSLFHRELRRVADLDAVFFMCCWLYVTWRDQCGTSGLDPRLNGRINHLYDV